MMPSRIRFIQEGVPKYRLNGISHGIEKAGEEE